MITSGDLFSEEYDEVNDLDVIQDTQHSDVEEITEQRQSGDENSEAEEEKKVVVKPKKIVRNPQPKLNADTLRSKRGLVALESYFERVKFKGKGSEEQDLNVLLKTYEYWCHRLFPKFKFEDCIERIETLGNKKVVQTFVKRVRLNMVLDDVPTNQETKSDSEDEASQTENYAPLSFVQTETVPELTEEQLEQIKLNREKAEKLRQERLAKARLMAQSSLQASSSLTESVPRDNLSALDDETDDLFSQIDTEMLENKENDKNQENEELSTPIEIISNEQAEKEVAENPPDEDIDSFVDQIMADNDEALN